MDSTDAYTDQVSITLFVDNWSPIFSIVTIVP